LQPERDSPGKLARSVGKVIVIICANQSTIVADTLDARIHIYAWRAIISPNTLPEAGEKIIDCD
jgi:hypothetical protein